MFKAERRKMHALVAGTLLAADAFAASGDAAVDFAGLDLEQLLAVEVVTASRFLQKASDAPSAVSVITAEDIRTYGYRTLADILRSLRGVYVTYDRIYNYAGVRGFSRLGDFNTRLLLLVDGNRVNDNVYDQAYIGTDFILDVDLIERVEFVPGPGAAVYGNNAFFGVINVITRNGKSLGGAQVSAAVASADTVKGRVSAGRRTENGTDWLISATGFGSDGRNLFFSEFNDPLTNNGIAENLDYDRGGSVFGKLSYGDLFVEVAHARRRKGVPTAPYDQVFNDSRSRYVDESSYLELRYEPVLESGTRLTARAFYGRHSFVGNYVYDYDPPVTENKDDTPGTWWGGELRVVTEPAKNHKLVAGVEVQRDRQRLTNFDVDPAFVYLDARNEDTRLGVYVQDELTFSRDWLLTAGLRFDHSDAAGGIFSPRVGVVFHARPETTFKLLYGSAFRASNVYERLYATPDSQLANPSLEPERIHTWEVVAEHSFDSRTKAVASAFTYQIEDLIEAVDTGGGVIQYQNQGGAAAKGIEVEAEHVWENGARVRASYSFQNAEDRQGKWIENSPRHLAKLNASMPFAAKNWRAGLEALYTGARKTKAGELGSVVLANLTLSTEKPGRGAGVSLSIYNLFDRRYADPARIEQPQDSTPRDGRMFRAQITYTF